MAKNHRPRRDRKGKGRGRAKLVFVKEPPRSQSERVECSGKSRLTKAQARTHAAMMEARHGIPFDYYRCAHCRDWHVGKMMASDRRRMEQGT